MGKEAKGKSKEGVFLVYRRKFPKSKGGVFLVYRRKFPRRQAKFMAAPLSPTPVQMDIPSNSSKHFSLINNEVHFRSRKPAKRSVATSKSIIVKKQRNSMDESIPATEDNHSLKQSKQPLCVNEAKVEEWPRYEFDSFRQMDETINKPCNDLGLTEVIDMFADLGTGEEVVSSENSAMVLFRGYKVKKVAAPMLRSIFEKHGDIASDCRVTTGAGRSMFLQIICDVMQTLQVSSFVDIIESEIKDMLDVVEDMRKLNLRVEWLQKRLVEILDAMRVTKDYPALKKANAEKSKAKQESKKTLRGYKEEMLDQSANTLDYKAKIQESESAMRELQRKALLEKEKLGITRAELKAIEDKVSRLGAKIRIFVNGSLIQDLY